MRIADDRIIGAPSAFDLDLLLRGFLVRLVALDSQLLDLRGETTWTIVAETHDGREPTFKGDGVSRPMAVSHQAQLSLCGSEADISLCRCGRQHLRRIHCTLVEMDMTTTSNTSRCSVYGRSRRASSM